MLFIFTLRVKYYFNFLYYIDCILHKKIETNYNDMMLEPWNDSSILPPPINMFLCVKKVDIAALKHVCNNINKMLSKQSPLHNESAICSRFLYKYDKKFRNDIGYRNFRKVYTALKKYLALNLLKDVDTFISALPSENDDEKYLPTRQMLEYLMLRIITFSMIMLRICVCAKQAAIFYLNRIKRGESHWMSLLPYALLSRIWSMTMVLIQHSTTWYSNLYCYLDLLEPKGLKFLPDNYELPQDLEIWLDLKNIDNFGRFEWDQTNTNNVDTGLLDDNEDNDLFDNILSFVNQSNSNESDEELEKDIKPLLDKCKDGINFMAVTTESFKVDQGQLVSRESIKIDQRELISKDTSKTDQGEALSRDRFKLLLNTQNKVIKENSQYTNEKHKLKHPDKIEKHNKKNLKERNITKENVKHSHKKVTNSLSLKEFINKEEYFRNGSDNRSLTGHLSLMQWHALRKALLKMCDIDANRKIERKFQKIWKEKCLDYK